MPKVAIITRTKNRHVLLRRAVESVLAQSFSDWTHVIVNDGGDREALKAFLDQWDEAYAGRLQVVHHEASRGMQAALNAGIASSESTFLCVHDDDDSWDNAFLGSCLGFLDEKGPDSVYQGVITQTTAVIESVSEDGVIEEHERRPYVPLEEVSLFRLGYENPFPPIAFCYRRSAHDTVGPYDERFEVVGDMDFNFRFLTHFEIGVIKKPLAFYHWRQTATQAELGNSITDGRERHSILYNEFKNHYLRGRNPDVKPEQALALNMARYLVEIEWITADDFHRGKRMEPKVDQLFEEVCGPGFRDRFESVRHALAILIDHAKNPFVHNRLDEIKSVALDLQQRTAQAEQARDQQTQEQATLLQMVDQQRQETAQLLHLQLERTAEALSQTNGLRHFLQQPSETPNGVDERLGFKASPDRIASILNGLALLMDHAKDPFLRESMAALREQNQDLLERAREESAERKRSKTLLRIGPLALTWKRRKRDASDISATSHER